MSMEYLFEEIKALKARVAVLETIDDVPVVCVASLTSNQATTSATPVVINYDNADIDTHNGLTVGSPPTTYTKYVAPVGGYYFVSAAAPTEQSSSWTLGELAQLSVLVNGSTVKNLDVARDSHAISGNNGAPGLGNGVGIVVAKNDEIQIEFTQESGAALNIIGDSSGPGGAGINTWVSIHRIRGY